MLPGSSWATPWKKNPTHNASYIVMAGIGETFKVSRNRAVLKGNYRNCFIGKWKTVSLGKRKKNIKILERWKLLTIQIIFIFYMLEKFDFVLIRSQFVKEPFLFKAFEENALTLLVQSKECLPLIFLRRKIRLLEGNV